MRMPGSLLIGIMCVALPVVAEAGKGLQDSYRWRNDNGSESTATYKDALNTPIANVKRGENIRLRFLMKNDDLSNAISYTGQVSFAEGSTNGPWTPVGVLGAEAFEMTATTGYTDGDSTTEQLNGAGGFSPGKCVELPSNVAVANIPAGQEFEMEYCFRATAGAKGNTTYYFKLPAGEYYNFAALTIEDTESAEPPNITSSLSTQNVAGGLEWSYTILASGTGPIQYGAQGLPAGITRLGNILNGRATVYGSFSVTLTVSNAWGVDTEVLPLAVSEPAAELIVDDADVNTSSAPFWGASASVARAWNGACKYSYMQNNETLLPRFRWYPDVPLTAQYRVYAIWSAGTSRGRNVPYTIQHAGGTSPEVFVDQRNPALAGQWTLLGTFTFNMGTNGWIELTGNDGQACADAIKLERVDGAPLDADGDGMLDSWENTYLGGTNASPTADADSDVMNNLQEFQAGTNPTNSTSVLAVVGLTGTGQNLDLKWLSADGKTYGIQKSTNLTEGFPLMEASGIGATPPTNIYPLTVGASGSGFYRVRLE